MKNARYIINSAIMQAGEKSPAVFLVFGFSF